MILSFQHPFLWLFNLHSHLPIRHLLWSLRFLITSSPPFLLILTQFQFTRWNFLASDHVPKKKKKTVPQPRHSNCWLKSISKPIDLLFHFSRDGNERHVGSGKLSSTLLTSVSLSPIDKYCFFQGDNLFSHLSITPAEIFLSFWLAPGGSPKYTLGRFSTLQPNFS